MRRVAAVFCIFLSYNQRLTAETRHDHVTVQAKIQLPTNVPVSTIFFGVSIQIGFVFSNKRSHTGLFELASFRKIRTFFAFPPGTVGVSFLAIFIQSLCNWVRFAKSLLPLPPLSDYPAKWCMT